MSNSPILAIPEIGPTQTNKYITHNDAIARLEASTNSIFTNASVGAGPIALTEDQATSYFVYVFSGASGAFDVTFPSTINGNNAKRVFAVRNSDTVNTMTVKASTGLGTSIAVPAVSSAIIYQNFQDMYAISVGTTAPESYDLGVYVPAQPGDAAEVLKFVAVRAFTIADDFAGSRAHVGTNPTATAVFTVRKNGASVGTLSISTVGAPTFATSGGATSFAVGDRLSITAPTPQDATLADVSIVFLGTKA